MSSDNKMEPATTLESVPSHSKLEAIEVVHTLGTVRLHNAQTKEIILVPQPSNDPNDPLQWYDNFMRPISRLTGTIGLGVSDIIKPSSFVWQW